MNANTRFAVIGLLKRIYFSHFSKPAWNRQIYRHVCRQRVARIVEIGIGRGERALRMIRLAQEARPDVRVHYAAIDLFEGRPEGSEPGISLRAAYQQLKRTGAAVRLVPGDPLSALHRASNDLVGTDLLIISADVDRQSLEHGWMFVPRMLHEKSLVVRLEKTAYGCEAKILSTAEILAAPQRQTRRRAA